MAAKDWTFYVYELTSPDGVVQYVGKGSGRRLRSSERERGFQGYEVARFRREGDAYAYEIQRIAEVAPALNIHPGGNGPRGAVVRKDRFERLIAKIGSRAYAARLLLAYAPRLGFALSKVEQIRRVAYG